MRRRVDRVCVLALVAALLVMSAAACSGDSGEEIVEISFDGSECTAAGPSEVPAGNQAFVLTNASDVGNPRLFVNKLVDGHTFQDALDLQTEAGGPGAYWPGQSWAVDALWSSDRPEIDLADNQELQVYTLEPGTHELGIYAPNPDSIWLCGPLDVVES